MTQAEYEAEMCFRLCKSIFSTLAAMGHISENVMYRPCSVLPQRNTALQLANWR